MATNKPDLSALTSKLVDTAGSTRAGKGTQQDAPRPKPRQVAGTAPPSRKNMEPVTGYFPKQVRKQIKEIALQRDTTLQNLMAEAFNDLFAKYGKPEIAPITAKRRKGDDAPEAERAAEQA